MILQLYIHIPFCKSKCLYCDFCSHPAPVGEMEAYGECLQKEIALAAARYPESEVSTVFVGGGTPSLLPPAVLEGILGAVKRHFVLLPNAEFTAEANPGTLTAQWLETARRYGLNRLSLGMQAAQDRLLQGVGRIHRFPDVQAAAALAKSQGILNMNLDVMFGLPEQSLQDYLETLEAAHSLAPAHVSAYSLIVEEGTPLLDRVEQGTVRLPPEDETAEMAQKGGEWLENRGYARYEISNYARPGFACRHNLGYWHGAWYAGLGLGAHSMLPLADGREGSYLRCENTTSMEAYANSVASGRLPRAAATPVPLEDAMFETMMLGLRTLGGVGEKEFEARHQKALSAVYGPQMERLLAEGLAVWRQGPENFKEGRFFALTPRGMDVQNGVLLRLME